MEKLNLIAMEFCFKQHRLSANIAFAPNKYLHIYGHIDWLQIFSLNAYKKHEIYARSSVVMGSLDLFISMSY